jgi:hypothetical protein
MKRLKFRQVEFTCISNFVPYLEYGECDETPQEEKQLIDDFVSSKLKVYNPYGYYFTYAKDTYYGRCQITGYMGTVTDVTIHIDDK